ncbi:flagellar type III secretion system pore protein FliP [Terrabacter carboxydivorans]|uniref:Flagellar biosynthetic protein FliP n=1 Tax=Terrabacter carboxydivorans TaxID=619730 RepID=A0ABP5YLH5_9MICO
MLALAALTFLAACALLTASASAGHAAEPAGRAAGVARPFAAGTTGVRTAGPASAARPMLPAEPTPSPTPSTGAKKSSTARPAIDLKINTPDKGPSSAVVTLIGIGLLSVAPALLLMMTSFTKIFVVLAMTRNALGLGSVPPNQVLAGLTLFLTLFIMWPVLTQVNVHAVQPYLAGNLDFGAALSAGAKPLSTFMLAHTRQEDIALMTRAAGIANPATPAATPLQTLVPAFMISELRAAFIIGFVIFIPFLVIDIVVSSALMSMGMMMLPPVMVSLPFKVLLFILVDGWGLVITALVQSYAGGVT